MKTERWLYSGSIEEQKLGMRVLVATEKETSIVRDHIFSILGGTNDHSVKVVALRGLALNKRIIAATSLAETDFVCSLLRNSQGDIRIAATQALARFPANELVTRALHRRYDELRVSGDVRERSELIRALAVQGRESERLQSLVESETMRELSRSDVTWSKKRKTIGLRLLFACDQIGATVSNALAGRIFELANDYRAPRDVRRIAAQTFGSVAPLEQNNARHLLRLITKGSTQMRISTYRAAAAFVVRCKSDYSVVSNLKEIIGELRSELTNRWHKEIHVAGQKIDYAGLKHIRNALLDIERMFISHDDLSDRLRSNRPSQTSLDMHGD